MCSGKLYSMTVKVTQVLEKMMMSKVQMNNLNTFSMECESGKYQYC